MLQKALFVRLTLHQKYVPVTFILGKTGYMTRLWAPGNRLWIKNQDVVILWAWIPALKALYSNLMEDWFAKSWAIIPALT